MNEVINILKKIHDEADHILGTEAEKPLVVARVNARVIKRLAKQAIKGMEKPLADELAIALDYLMQSEGGESREDADSKCAWRKAINALNRWRSSKKG